MVLRKLYSRFEKTYRSFFRTSLTSDPKEKERFNFIQKEGNNLHIMKKLQIFVNKRKNHKRLLFYTGNVNSLFEDRLRYAMRVHYI